jgi:NAD(P)-dependent dehydrogenase (short-subunit alcohol dehydrogenase family)
MTKRLEGKAIVVTGAARGLGREYALRFATEGAQLTLADISDCSETVNRCEALGAEVLGLTTDVSDEAATLDMARQANEHFGRIDGLMNNAGIMRDLNVKSLLDVDMKTWDRVFAVNTRGTFLGIRAVFPYMQEHRAGTIINVGSGTMLRVARAVDAVNPHYVASKSAIMGITRSVAKELGQYGINVVTLAPGSTMSDRDPAVLPQDATREPTVSLGRAGVPSDVTGVAAFLFSDDAKFISGQMLVVNGGREVY